MTLKKWIANENIGQEIEPFPLKRSEYMYIWREGNSYKEYIIQYISPVYKPYLWLTVVTKEPKVTWGSNKLTL